LSGIIDVVEKDSLLAQQYKLGLYKESNREDN